MNSENKVTDDEIYKAIGHLEEATEVMQMNHDSVIENEKQALNILSAIGRIIESLITKYHYN